MAIDSGCLPTRHSKKDARYSSLRKHPFLSSGEERGETDVFAGYRYSSDSVGGTSTESASPEKRKGEDLGWFPEVVGSSKSSLSEESSTETDFIPEPRAETSKYGRKRTRGKRDNYVSWEKIAF